MGKLFWLVFIIIVIVLGFYGVSFYQQNLRGVLPSLENPPDDIAKLIENAHKIDQNTTDMPLALPPGFAISIFAKGLGDPRVIVRDPAGNLVVSIPNQGKVVALPDSNNNGEADSIVAIATGLNKPHGITFRCINPDSCKLYVAETDKLTVFDYDTHTLNVSHKQKLLDLPSGGNHITRSLLFLPSPRDAELLISIGSTCNVCIEKDSQRAAILIFDTNTGKIKPFASGLRNSVFMTLNSVTGKVWATEMGRDLLGDDIPPDEINIIEEGKNYGWPNCYGKNIHDTAFDHNVYIRAPCSDPFEVPSYIDIPAHSAPLGLAFVPEDSGIGGWPQEYWHNLFVAYHGSWNRSVPTGYKIVRYQLDTNGNMVDGPKDFITGWLVPSKGSYLPAQASKAALGRPVGILVEPGGNMFISDDKAGVIYHVVYGGARVVKTSDTPKNAAEDMLHVTAPKPNDIVKSPLMIKGEARGTWYFEASFPVVLLDDNGKEIAQYHAQAQGDWMTENFVPFTALLAFQAPLTDKGTLVLKKDNPSGLPEHDASVKIPIRFR